MDKKKVFIGTKNITGRYRDLKFFFNEVGFDTFIVSQEQKTRNTFDFVDVCLEDHYSYYYKGVRPKKLQTWLQTKVGIRKKVLTRALQECDIFIFFWETLFLDFTDLEVIKAAGKTIIICFVGSDIRNEVLYKETLEEKGRSLFPITEVMTSNYEKKKRHYAMAKKYAAAIFSRPDQSQIFDQPYYRMLPFINLEDFRLKSKNQNEIPVIIHAPTRADLKGTNFFESNLEELKNEGVIFEYRRMINLTQDEVRNEFLNADIVIDQLFLLGGGKVSVEAMAQGCIAMSAMGYGDFESPYPEQAPIVDFKEDDFKAILKNLIENVDLRQEIADKGPDFVRRNLNCKDFVAKMIAIREGQKILPDFFPKGFKKES